MAETAAAIFGTSAASGSTAAAGTAASTAAASAAATAATAAAGPGLFALAPASVAAATGTGVSTLGIISGGLQAISAISSIASGLAASKGLKEQSLAEKVRARQETLIAKKEQIEILERLNNQLSANRARAGASGITSAGSVAAAQLELIDQAEFELDTSRDNAIVNSGARTSSARALEDDASAAVISGVGGALNAGFQAVEANRTRG